jgi:hypothetical protein
MILILTTQKSLYGAALRQHKFSWNKINFPSFNSQEHPEGLDMPVQIVLQGTVRRRGPGYPPQPYVWRGIPILQGEGSDCLPATGLLGAASGIRKDQER